MTIDEMWNLILQEVRLYDEGVTSKSVAISWIKHYTKEFEHA